jgi:hypothetical protein
MTFCKTVFLRKVTTPFRCFSITEIPGEAGRSAACRVRTDMERLANRAIGHTRLTDAVDLSVPVWT